jgi:hypothetical protein
MVRLKMKRWACLISILALVAIVAAAAAAPAEAQEQEVTSIAPGGTYHVYFTVKKPAGMALTGNWEVRVYFYNGLNCFNTAPSGNDDGWWQPEGSTEWLYTGYWDHRSATRNVSWSSPDEKEWAQWVPIIHYPALSGNHEARYPPTVGENYEGKMSEIPIGQTISLRARLLLRNLANVTFDTTNQIVTFKYGGKTYSCAYTPYYEDYDLPDLGATLAQSEGTGEWSLRFDQNSSVIVDENAPTTGRITIPGIIDFSMLSNYVVTGGFPLWIIIAAIVVVIVVVVIGVLAVKVRGAPKVSP